MSHHGNAPRRAGMAAFSPAFASSAQSTGSTSQTSGGTLVSIFSEGVLQAMVSVKVSEPCYNMTGEVKVTNDSTGVVEHAVKLDHEDIIGLLLSKGGEIEKCEINYWGRQIDLVNGYAQGFEMIHKPEKRPVLEAIPKHYYKRTQYSWYGLKLDNFVKDGVVVIGGIWDGSRFTPKESNCAYELKVANPPKWFVPELKSLMEAISDTGDLIVKAKECFKKTYEVRRGCTVPDGGPEGTVPECGCESHDNPDWLKGFDPRFLGQFEFQQGCSSVPKDWRMMVGDSMAVWVDQAKSDWNNKYVKVAVFAQSKREDTCKIRALIDWNELSQIKLSQIPCFGL